MWEGLGASRKLGAVAAVMYPPAGSYKLGRPQQWCQMKCVPQQRGHRAL